MKIKIWGCRGSLPRSFSDADIRKKLDYALHSAQYADISSDAAIDAFISRLPRAVRSTYGSSTSCVEVSSSEAHLILDAGSGLRQLGQSLMTNPGPHHLHLLLSHLHWDHLQGFPFFIPAFIPGNSITIYGCHPDIQEAFRFQQDPPFFPVPLSYMQAHISFVQLQPGCSSTIGGMQVTPLAQNHPGTSYGYRISDDTHTMVYSTDSEHKQDAYAEDYPFVSFIQDADLLLFDAQYSLHEAIQTKENWGHSSNMLGCELASRANVKRLCLFHHDPQDDDFALDALAKRTRDYLHIIAPRSTMEVDVCAEGKEFNL